ncbi:MAG: tRNA glutamyl-Q(34) synthetase GluQRS [Myxococcota bacterium]
MSRTERPRFRYAPTPSRPLHLGNGLAALVGWAAARAAGGTFVLRVEDIDRTRCKPEFEEAVYRDLEWLGLDWDEGPDVGGPHAPYRQSERFERYEAAAEWLQARGLAYPCACSRAQVREAQRAPHLHEGGEIPYPGTCRPPEPGATPPAELRTDRGGRRLAVEHLGDEAVVRWHDAWQGGRVEDVRLTCGDFLLGRPGHPSYQLAVVIDDAAMDITDVVRGEDLLGSTARQILLHRVMGHAPPRFAHHPLVLDAQGRKLSKRDRDLTLTAMREDDADAGRLIARLAASVQLVPPDTARLEPRDLVHLLQQDPLSWSDGPLLD